jgi:hypothetical protein
MAVEMDFPADPVVGQHYTNSIGVVYAWDGAAWVVGFYDTSTETFDTVGDILDQIRTTLQDTDLSSGEYRYSNDSLVLNLNQGMLEMYRMRPDIFLENNFKVPRFNSAELDAPLVIEPQFVPPLVYYVVGFTQLRDDEPTQDQRASMFLSKFSSMMIQVA